MTSHLPYYHESQFGIHPCEKCNSSWRQENNTKIDRYHTKISWCHASHWQQPATGSHDILHTNATAHHNAGHITNATFQLSLLGGKTTAFFWLMDKRKWASARPITYRLVCGIDGRFVCPSLTMSARVPFLVNLTMQTHMHTCTVTQSFLIFFVVVHAAVAHVAYKLIAMNRCQILTLATHVKPHAADIECKFFSPHLTVCARCSAVHIGLSMLIPYRLLPHNKTLHVLPEYGYICNWKIMCAHFANVFIYFFRWLLFSYLTVNLDANVPHHRDWERDKCIGLMATPCTIHNQHLHCNFQFSMHAKSVSWSDAYSLGSRCGFATYLFFSFSVYMSAAISWSDMTTKCTLQHSIFLFFNFINNEDVLTNDKRLLQKR